MTHTALVRWVFGVLFLAASCAHLGCNDKPSAASSGKEGTGPKAPASGEQSPNARILPEPLENGLPDIEDEFADDGKGRPATEPRETARPFPVTKALGDDNLKRGPAAGLEMEFQIAWPEARKSVQAGKEMATTWPRFQVQLLSEISSRPARMRWVLEGRVFPFPEKTEIRARADRIGHLILWPDRRSYRIAPTGSLHALFADRRVDRVPFVEPEQVTKGTGTRLGKPTIVSTVTTPVGTGTLEFVEVSDLPYAAELLCSSFLEILRVKTTPELCPSAHLPVHFEIKWPNEESVQFSVLSWGTAANFELDDFRMPPDLPIHKRGELPPFESYYLNEASRFSLLPLTKEKAPPAPPPPAEPTAGPPPAEPPAPAAPGPPRNQIVLQNKLSRPLVVIVNRVPYMWLTPGAAEELYLSSADIRVSARDFLGETIFVERLLVAPAQLYFGETGGETNGTEEPAP